MIRDSSPVDAGPTSPGGVRLGRGDLGDDEVLIERWAQSRRRSRERHAAARSQRLRGRLRLGGGLLVAAALVATAAGLAVPALDAGRSGGTLGFAGEGAIVLSADGSERRGDASGGGAGPAERRGHKKPPERPPILPAPGTLKDAWRYAQARGGAVSIAVVDTRGRLRGEDEDRRYSAASVVKSMLLAAELRRLEREGLPLDAGTESLLRAMITYSDNDAADSIYSRVGDGGLYEVARAAGMTRFTVAGHWGNAQVTAADLARMFFDLDRVYAGRHREFALGLLGSIVPEQAWGIPAAAGERWAVRFKGGWVMTDDGQIAHQAAELRDGNRRLAMTILTDGQPSMAHGTETVRGVAERLLESP